jgi:hypothetical protein
MLTTRQRGSFLAVAAVCDRRNPSHRQRPALIERRYKSFFNGLLTIVLVCVLAGLRHAASMPLASFPDSANPSSYSVAAAIANVPTNAGVVYDAIGRTNSIQVYNFGQLVYSGPIDVTPTLERIRHGCSIPAVRGVNS